MSGEGPSAGILELAERWRRAQRRAAAVRAAAASLPLLAAAGIALRAAAPAWAAGLALASAAAGAWTWHRCRPGSADVAAMTLHLDRVLPEAEASAELLLAEPEDLPLVARLQRERVLEAVADALPSLGLPSTATRRARNLAGVAFAGSLLAWLALPLAAPSPELETAGEDKAEKVATAPEVVAVRATVTPPPYTGRPERRFEGLEVRAEQGALVTWEVEVAGAGAAPALVFDEGERLALERREGDRFAATRQADESHLYRLEAPAVVNRFAGYSRFEVIPDRPPEIEIVAPPAFVELGSRAATRLDVRVELVDDYGLGSAALVATVASGFGELVEFRERRIGFQARETRADGTVVATSLLDLDALGMRPGAELFLFAEAHDSREPQPNVGRSATHIVRIPGGSAGSVGLSARLPVLRVPEFFRSQRQIILDTEKLLADQELITGEDFRRRSESLGFDQRALRMRYGGLLGEEFESGRPAGADSEDEHEEEHGDELRRLDEMEPSRRLDPGDAFAALPEGLAHEHDSAEIATYFDSEVKADLKAALAEMWGAEGRLRSLEPRQALPFEYRALQLLKQVQQRSRLYVRKIGFEPPQLYPQEARLTGELDGVLAVRRRHEARDDPSLAAVRYALAALAEPPAAGAMAASEDLVAAARVAAGLLVERARDDPGLELEGLESLRAWILALEARSDGSENGALPREDAVAALWSLLPDPPESPAPPPAPGTALAESYRRHLAAEGLAPGGSH